MYFPTNIFSWFISLLKDCRFNWNNIIVHYVKSVRIRSYLGPHFSRIFPHSDWIGRNTEYLSVFCPNAGKCRKNADQNNSEYVLFLRSEGWSFSGDKSESEIEDFVWQLSPGEKYPSDERKIFCGVRVETKRITDQLHKTWCKINQNPIRGGKNTGSQLIFHNKCEKGNFLHFFQTQ